MKTIQKAFALIIILSTLFLSACGAQEASVEKGPYSLPSSFEYYYRLDNEETCKDSWVSKAKSGDANFAGFEVAWEIINKDVKPNKYGSDAMITYHFFLKSITIENYLVDITNQTVVFVGASGTEPSQAIDPNTLLTRANELAKTAPDIRIGILYTYLPEKFDTEEWVMEFGIQCDPTNTMIYTVPW